MSNSPIPPSLPPEQVRRLEEERKQLMEAMRKDVATFEKILKEKLLGKKANQH